MCALKKLDEMLSGGVMRRIKGWSHFEGSQAKDFIKETSS